jgi:hypothetical protein
MSKKLLALATMISTLVAPLTVFAQDLSVGQVDLSIGVESDPSEALPMFVFIKGRLSGMVPGIIMMPSQVSVPVEIGIAQLNRSPLYSFNFGPEVLKAKKVDIVTTNIDPISDSKNNFLTLHKDLVETVKLTKIHDNVYGLTLPSTAYLAIEKFKGESKEFGVFPVKKAEDYGLSSHLIYDKSDQKIVSLGTSDSWSGTNVIAFVPGGIGYVSEKQKWTIVSKPEGADIYTDAHPGYSAGKTNSTVEVTKSISSYALLKMKGYQQCVIQMDGYQQCTERDCIKDEDTDGSVTFTCNLTKAP